MATRNHFWVIVAKGFHPFPSRTRKLSPSAPMVLYARVCGRVGRCPIKKKAPRRLGAFSFAGFDTPALRNYNVIMKSSLVQIGNSRGVRIPKAFLEEAGLRDDVEIEVRGSQIVVRAA